MRHAAPYGLRVLGSASGRREVVDFDKAVAAYSNADPAVRPELPAFLSAFRYPADLRRHVEAHDGTAGYCGPIGLAGINFDIDRANLDDAVRDARRLVAHVADRWRLDARDMVVSFSGSRGFHLTVPTTGIEPAPGNHAVARALACRIAGAVGITIDESVYLPTQLWRAPNSRHPRTGFYKVRLDADDLLHMSTDAVRRLAAEPIPFDPPSPAPCPMLLADWNEAVRQTRQDAQRRADRQGGTGRTGGRINALTWRLITEPTDIGTPDTPGDRHRLLYAAARNLMEFGTVAELVAAMLTPCGLDMGLAPKEVARQIECGVKDSASTTTEAEA